MKLLTGNPMLPASCQLQGISVSLLDSKATEKGGRMADSGTLYHYYSKMDIRSSSEAEAGTVPRFGGNRGFCAGLDS